MYLVSDGMNFMWAEVMQVLHKVCEGGDGCPEDCVGVGLWWRSKSGR